MKKVTQSELAGLLGVDVRTVRRWDLRRDPKGRYDLARAIAWVREHDLAPLRAQLEAVDARHEEAMLTRAKRKLAELEVAKAEGQLITLDYMERQLDGILQRLRAQLLVFPGKFAPRLVGLRSVPDAQTQLDSVIRELMVGLQDVGEDAMLEEGDEDAEHLQTSAKGT